MIDASPPISEAVSLLNIVAPAELFRLKQELPSEIHPLLIPGGLAGSIATTLKARAAVQIAALKQITERIKIAAQSSERRLRISKRVRLVGDVAAVLGSSSVLAGTSSESAPGWVVLTGGIIALVGALSGVLSDYSTRLAAGSGGSLFEIYSALSEARFEADSLQTEIKLLLKAAAQEDVEERLSAAIGEANALCRKVQKVFPHILQSDA